jgi:hypothetical protein
LLRWLLFLVRVWTRYLLVCAGEQCEQAVGDGQYANGKTKLGASLEDAQLWYLYRGRRLPSLHCVRHSVPHHDYVVVLVARLRSRLMFEWRWGRGVVDNNTASNPYKYSHSDRPMDGNMIRWPTRDCHDSIHDYRV